MTKNSPLEQPDFGDQDAVVAWLSDESATQEERQLRASLVKTYEGRQPAARRDVLNAVAGILPGPPSANQ